MGDTKDLKETHPQKHYVKVICKVLYALGLGNYWYEKPSHGPYHKLLYKMYVIVIHTFLIVIIIDQMLANFRKDMTVKESSDLQQAMIAHPTVYLKAVFLFLKKDKIRILLRKLLEDNREVYFSLEFDKASVKKAKRYGMTLMLVSYFTVLIATFDGVVVYIKEGLPIRTEVVYYPNNTDQGLVINIIRFLIHFHWWYMVTIMNFVDCLAFCCLIFLQFRFKFLQNYFENMREKFLENAKYQPREQLEQEFKRKFVFGIKLHEGTLWITRNVQFTLGNTYSLQLLQSIILLVLCLLKLVTLERTLSFLVANFFYTSCMIVLTGTYTMASGDITHEASLLSTSIFYCGWELSRADVSFRTLIVVTLIRAQAPVCMTAFGIFTLSYANFIAILRSSYSFFAVMY